MKTVGLFAGIGGFELGMAQAGHLSVLNCEILDIATAVLRARFPQTPIHNDICTLKNLPADTDIVCAGFPCQDLSQAGKTVGIGGARSGLVREALRLVKKRRPKWVVLENVSFMLRLAKGRALKEITAEFEALGYRWAYRVVNSLAWLPQRRERVFLVAAFDEDPADVLLVDDVEPVLPKTDLNRFAHGFYWTEGIRGLGWAVDSIPTLKNGSTIGIASPPAILFPDGRAVKPDIRDAERLQGFPKHWTEPATAVAKASLRWSLVGNAVSVPVAEWLGRRLSNPGQYDLGRDTPLGQASSWPNAARFDGSKHYKVDIGSYPVWAKRPPLAKFLHHQGELLSPRATRGFLGRTERASLIFPMGFRERLRRHLHDVEQLEQKLMRRLAAA